MRISSPPTMRALHAAEALATQVEAGAYTRSHQSLT